MTEYWKYGHWADDEYLKRSKPPYSDINTWSNIVYVIAGALYFLQTGDERFAIAMFWLGLGSAVYHAFKTIRCCGINWAAGSDDSGMFAVLGYLATGSWIGLLTGALFGLMRNKFDPKVNLNHAIGIVFAIIVLQAGVTWMNGLAILTFGLAYLAWNLDRERWAPMPIARWCHGVWHLLTAIGFYLLAMVGA